MKIRESARLRRAKIAGIMLLAVSPMLASSAAAQAAAKPAALTATSVSYNVSWSFKSRPLNKCVIFTATGKVAYKAGVPVGARHWEWNNQSVVAPRLTASVHAFGNGSCIGPATIQSMSMAQHWAGGFTCGINPSISVSVPWGVSVGGWPSCGNRRSASRGSSFPVTSASYIQDNSGSPIRFGNASGATAKNFPCIGVFVSATLRIANHTDSFTGGSKRICLSRV